MIRINALCAQAFACFAVNMCSTFMSGMALGWATAVLPMLSGVNVEIPMDDDQIGWIMSIMGIGGITGSILTWLLVDRIGRKPVLLMCGTPMILAQVIMTVKQEYVYLLIGRVLTGVTMGVGFAIVPLFTGEITDNKIRGALVAIGTVTLNSGNVFVVCIAPYVDLGDLNLILALVTSILIWLLLFVPESPYYSVMRGDTAKATKALVWLKRSTDVKNELLIIAEYVENRKSEKSEIFDLVTKRAHRRASIIIVVITCLEVYSGCNGIPTYAYDILDKSGVDTSLDTLVLVSAVSTMLASFVGVLVVDSLGRRPVLFISTAVMMINLIGMGIFFTLQDNGFDVSGFAYVPFIGVLGYTISNACGPQSLPGIVMSEYFSTSVKAKASMLYSMLLVFGAATAVKVFQVIADQLGLGPTFFICCVPLIVGTVTLYFIMPETKGCSLQTIEDMHNGHDSSSVETSTCC